VRHLYEISSEYAELLEAIYDATEEGNGEIAPENVERLSKLEGELSQKVDACCRVLRDMEATQAVCKAEADRLQARQRAVSKHCDWLKGYMKECMEKAHVDKLDAGPFRVAIRSSPESVEILNLDEVPHDYDMPQERKVALSTIKQALKAGTPVPGVQLVKGTHLRIS
jgi:hypothetical protein